MKKLRELYGTVKQKYSDVVALMSDKSKPFYIQNFVAALLIGFFATTVLFMSYIDRTRGLDYTNLDYVTSQHILIFAMTVVTVAAIVVMGFFLSSAEKIIPISLVLSVTAFGYLIQNSGQRTMEHVKNQVGWCGDCGDSNHCIQKFFDWTGGGMNIWLGLGIALMIFIACRWVFDRFAKPFEELKIGFGFVKAIVAIMFVYFVGYMSVMGVCRYYSFTYDTFDFGIFAQMFDYMKTTGLPYTTVERNTLLSHFAVHFSPFFYVLLPGYMVFSTPAYLCVAQTLFVGVSVFAVYGIAKTLGFSPKQTLLACALFLLYPSFSFGLYFDFHENKFLTFCVLYAIYFLLKRKFIPFYIFAILLCTVKEDSAIYLVAIALFMLFHEKLVKHGIFTLLLAVGYFVFALKMVEVCGGTEENQFAYRYAAFALNGEATVGNIIKITILDFGYTLSQMFQAHKIDFLLWMFLPVLFTPFVTKKISVLFLLAPMTLINFMSNWPYQTDVDYQYTFGSAALIIVAALIVIRQLSPKNRNMILTAGVAICFVLTVPRVLDRNQGYINGYTSDSEKFKEAMVFIDDTLDQNSVIGVEGNVMPMMYDYPYLFLDPHSDELAAKIEYYVAKKDDGDKQKLIDRGFKLVADNEYIVIYKNPNYKPAK